LPTANYGNGNTASVEGDDSYASAGGLFRYVWSAGTDITPGDDNVASVTDNNSWAVAGPGNGNQVIVNGGQSASAAAAALAGGQSR
jgi:hypothetical protein